MAQTRDPGRGTERGEITQAAIGDERVASRGAAYPEMVAVLVGDDQQRAEGLGMLERHRGRGVQLREAGHGGDEGVAQHVHAQQAGHPHRCHQPRQAQVGRRACITMPVRIACSRQQRHLTQNSHAMRIPSEPGMRHLMRTSDALLYLEEPTSSR